MSDLSHIYAKLHANRYEHIEQARRARDMQSQLHEFRVSVEFPIAGFAAGAVFTSAIFSLLILVLHQ